MKAVSLVNGPVISQREFFAENTASVERFRSSESKRLLEFPQKGKARVTVNVFLDKKRLRVESVCNGFGL